MAKTRSEIDAVWEPLHAKLTKLYYIDKKVDKATFDKLHGAIWLLHEQDSIQAGILPDFPTDEETKKLRSTQITEIIQALGGESQLKSEMKKVLG